MAGQLLKTLGLQNNGVVADLSRGSFAQAVPLGNEVQQVGLTGPTLEEVFICHKEARDFYKNGLKSWNKIYDLDTSDSEKRDRRNENADESRTLSFRQTIQSDFLKRPFEEIGKDIFSENISNGNCTEMSCICAYFISIRYPLSHRYLVATLMPTSRDTTSIAELSGGSNRATIRSL
jgi:hypothetical protein